MEDFLKKCEECNPGEKEFLQAVSEVVKSVKPVIDKHPEYRKEKILDRMVEILEKRQVLKTQLRSALTYPMVLCVIATLVIIFVLVYVLPKFTAFFAGKESILPLSGRHGKTQADNRCSFPRRLSDKQAEDDPAQR